MAEHIDRQETIKAVARLVKNGGEEYITALCDAEEAIKGMPTADVAEVKHGTYVKEITDSAFGKGWGWICSVCEHQLPFHSENKYNYCPYCGARMDGE